jgi:parallel beta-helix repeat protein
VLFTIVIIKTIDSQLSMVNSTLVVTLYVNPMTGNDTNTGSRLSPFKSLTRALKVTKIPTIIHLESGTYNAASGEVFPLIILGGVTVVGNEANKGVGIVISGSGEYQSPSFGIQNITLLLVDNASLLGVTVTNPSAKGTGIWIESAAPTLSNNTLSNCGREGVFTTGTAKPAILDNIFVQNTASGLVMAGHSQGEVRRNVFQRNPLGIAISDFAVPTIANNKLSENRTAIALSRHAQPVLRQNLLTKNTQGGLLVNGNAVPDLGNTEDPGDNIFRDHSEFDLYNATTQKLVSVGNQLNAALIKGLVELIPANEVTLSTSFSDSPTESSSQQLPLSPCPLVPLSPSPPLPASPELKGHWAEPFIQALARMDLIHAFADGSYQPDKPMTRAQYAAMVAIAFNPFPKIPSPDFTDVPKDFWAYSAIQIAASGGFVGGFSDRTFRPDRSVQRLQVIVSLVNGLGLPAVDSGVVEVYSDRHTIPDYARTAVATATQRGIVVNYPDPKVLAPLRFATRAEVAAMVYQALVAIGRTSAIKIIRNTTLGEAAPTATLSTSS